MTDPANPFFARTMANRIWGHFFGRGLIHPIDDARSTNPPSHPELLDALAHDFVRERLRRQAPDPRLLHLRGLRPERRAERGQPRGSPDVSPGTIRGGFRPKCCSMRSARPSASRPTSPGARQVPGRDPGDRPAGRGGAQLLPRRVRPARRASSCECERVGEASLGQALALIGSPILEQKLTAKDGLPARLASDPRPVAEVVDDLFVRVLGRPARSGEIEKARRFLEAQPDRRVAFESLLWSLLASAEFLFNH